MEHWDSYDYPEENPIVRIFFDGKEKGRPVTAWICKFGRTAIPPRVGVEETHSVDSDDEVQAKIIMNAHADKLIKRDKLKSVLMDS